MSVNVGEIKSAQSQIGLGLLQGTGMMLATAPAVNGFNRISVIACRHNTSSTMAAWQIYSGEIEGLPPSLRHYNVGMTAYLAKESFRIGAKAVGFSWFKPNLEKYFSDHKDPHSSLKTNLIVSSTLSFFEMAINPIDTWCTRWQSGDPRQRTFQGQTPAAVVEQLYRGAGLNGVRQFKQWIGYSIAEEGCNSFMDKYTVINPHSLPGIILKSWPIALSFTTFAYPLHRLKTEMQYDPALALKAKEEKRSRVAVVYDHIVATQTKWGMMRGFWAKVASNSILMMGVSILLEQGRLHLKSKDNS